MALDFHRFDNNEYLFSLDERKYNFLDDIFESYKHWTGTIIDQYNDCILATQNQKILIRIIDNYISETNLNQDKEKTVAILEFRGLLSFFSNNNNDLQLLGD